MENAKTPNILKLESDLKLAKQEIKELWNTLECPEQFSKLISGL